MLENLQKRGEIIDIFSPSCNFPIRIFFFNFEKIENLQEISIKSQETTNSVDFYKLIPASEIFFDDHNISFFREQFREIIVSNKEDYYNSISKKIIEGSEQFFPILNRSFSSLLEYLHGFKLFFTMILKNNLKIFSNQKLTNMGPTSNSL